MDHLSFEQAIARAFPGSGAVGKLEAVCDEATEAAVQAAARPTVRHRAALGGVYVGHSDGRGDAVAYIDHVIGRTEYITWLAVLDLQGRVRDVAVLSYREPIGGEIAEERWLAQFHELDHDTPPRLNRNVTNIAGATLSSRAIVERLRYLLAYHQQVVLPQLPAWLARQESPTGRATPVLAAREIGGSLLRLQAAAGSDPARLEALLDEAARLDQQLSAWVADGELARLNATGSTVLGEECLALVVRALELAAASDGVFDPTIGPLLTLWWRASEAGQEPSTEAIAAARALVDHHRVARDGRRVSLGDGMRFDCGGIRKGFVLDRILGDAILTADWGGSIWHHQGPETVPVAIAIADRQLGEIRLAPEQALAASGSAHRSFVIGERRYAHIIDPRDGRPGDPQRAAWALAADAATADALATACCLLDEAAAARLCERLQAGALLWNGERATAVGSWPPDWQASTAAMGP